MEAWRMELRVKESCEILKTRSSQDQLKLIYEWVKTGHIDFKIFERLMGLVMFTDLSK